MLWHQGELTAALAIASSMTWGKLFNLPVLGFLIYKIGTVSTYQVE